MTGPLGIVDSATLLAAFENYVDMVMETDFKWFKNLSASAFTSLVLCLSKPHCVNITSPTPENNGIGNTVL